MTKSDFVAPAYMRVGDFAVWCGLSRPTIFRLIRQGKLRRVKVGGASLIDMSSARALLERGDPKSVRGG
jgi:excisionase family DNA binding protein